MNKNDLASKQQFLHEQIIQQQYDPQEFQQFMDNQKGLDLDQYTLDELKDIVRQFKGSIIQTCSIEESSNPFNEWSGRQSPEKQASEELSRKVSQEMQKMQGQKEAYQKDSKRSGATEIRRPTKTMDPQEYARLMGLPTSKQPLGQKKEQQARLGKQEQKRSKQEKGVFLKQQKYQAKNFSRQNKEQKLGQLQSQQQKNDTLKTQASKDSSKTQKHVSRNNDSSFKQNLSHQEVDRGLSVASVKSFNSGVVKSYIITEKQTVSGLYRTVHQKKLPFSVKVRSFSKKQTSSLFKVTYITYLVQSLNGWKVHRRYNDFSWLYRYFKEMYIGIPVPPIPQKTKFRSFNDDHLEQRMIIFERFLEKAVQIPEICADPIIQSFLSMQSVEQFSSLKEKYDQKVKGKDNIICCLGGQNAVNLETQKLPSSKKNFYDKSSQCLSVLNEELTQIETYLKLASQKAVNATNIFRQLTTLHRNNEIPGSSIFDVMGEFISQVGYILMLFRYKLDNQYYHLRNFIDNVWMYEQKYKQTIYLNIESLQKQIAALDTKKSALSSKDGHAAKLAEKTGEPAVDIQNRQMMEYLKAKELYRIKLSFLSQEIDRHEREDLIKVAKEWLSGMTKYMDQTKAAMMSGVDHLTRAMCISEGKDLMEVEYISNINSRDRVHSLMIREID